MPSSEEESLWLVGSEAGALSSGLGAQPQHHQQHHQQRASRHGEQRALAGVRFAGHHLYTEEMQAQPGAVGPAHPAANQAAAQPNAGSGATVQDSAEHDLIDNAADATLLAQFHEDAIKQVVARSFRTETTRK